MHIIPSQGIKNKPGGKRPVLPVLAGGDFFELTGQDLRNETRIAHIRKLAQNSRVRISLKCFAEATREEQRQAIALIGSLETEPLFYGQLRRPIGNDLFGAMLRMLEESRDERGYEQARLATIRTIVQLHFNTLDETCERMVASLRELGKEALTHAELSTQAREIWRRDYVDIREAMFNDAAVGPVNEIQVSPERIISVTGVLYDLDPHRYVSGAVIPKVSHDVLEFYEDVVRTWLNRHPVLSRSEIRDTGTGLHAILRLQPAIEIKTDEDRQRWAGIVKVVQAALPNDPNLPGITATTRAIDSFSSKDGSKVRRLVKGKPITEKELLTLYDDMRWSPFKTLLNILSGSDCVSPCPVCEGKGTKLIAMDDAGRCYGSCGTVKLETLYNAVLNPRKIA